METSTERERERETMIHTLLLQWQVCFPSQEPGPYNSGYALPECMKSS